MVSRMGFIQVSIVLPIIINYVLAYDNCCTKGQAILFKKDVCWDPKTNVTTSLSLKCNNTLRFYNNYKINEAEDLVLQLGTGFDEPFPTNEYCMGVVTTKNDVTLNKTQPVAILCADEEEEEIFDDRILGYTMILSVIFLTATVLIYSLIPELRDVQGKSIINFCGSLAIGLLILVIMKLMTYSDMALCATRGFLAYFFVIAAFFWTNVIAIQVMLNTRRPATIDYGWGEFKWYAIYAWGCPSVLTICMAMVNFYPGTHQRPGIGLNHCWFFSKRQQWYYMYSVMSLLLAVNIGIFIYTSLIIWRLSFSSNQIRALKFKFMMTVRLIILMGLPWIFEMVGSLAERHIIWAILDLFNTLQGILIFLLLVVFRKRVIKMMYKHGWLAWWRDTWQQRTTRRTWFNIQTCQ